MNNNLDILATKIIEYESLQAKEIHKTLYITPILILWLMLSVVFIRSGDNRIGYGILIFFLFCILISIYEFKRIIARKKLHNYILKEMHKVQPIEDILGLTEKIYAIFRSNIRWIRFSGRSEKEYNSNIAEYYIQSLFTLRNNLRIGMIGKQKMLKFAKDEVEINIQGTSELNKVSDLQQARLDRQIEQFEELQKVLVKM